MDTKTKIYKCGGCEAEVTDSQKFCSDCGEELASIEDASAKLKKGQTVVLKADPSMDLKAGEYEVVKVGKQDDDVVYWLKNKRTGKTDTYTVDYIDGNQKWQGQISKVK